MYVWRELGVLQMRVRGRPEEVVFGQRPRGEHGSLWGKAHVGGGNGRCTGSEGNSKEACVVQAEE